MARSKGLQSNQCRAWHESWRLRLSLCVQGTRAPGGTVCFSGAISSHSVYIDAANDNARAVLQIVNALLPERGCPNCARDGSHSALGMRESRRARNRAIVCLLLCPSVCSAKVTSFQPTLIVRVTLRSGGVAGEGLNKVQRSLRQRGFSEKDQEDLYMSSHGGKSQGRSGLVVGSLPKKVAGARWTGTKTKLDSDSEAEAEVWLHTATVLQINAHTGCSWHITFGRVVYAHVSTPGSIRLSWSVQDGVGIEENAETDAEVNDERSDMLPGGSVVFWPPSGRPEWFLGRPSAAEAGIRSFREPRGLQDVTEAVVTVLSPGKRKVCKRVAKQALKQDAGGVKVQALVKQAVRALQAAGEDDARTLKALIKHFYKSSPKWAVRGGVLVEA
jgi:hypothetical protein